MEGRIRWLLIELSRKLWLRAAAYATLGLAAALLAWLVQPFVPTGLGQSIGAGAVDAILSVLASSMLAVTTFALSIMVTALGNAGSNATPRATALLIQDPTTQNVLSTFLGSFLFSLVGIIALKVGIYGEGGRAVLFMATLAMVAVVVLSMLRWIAHLSDFGRMADTAARVEAATAEAVLERVENPYLGGHPQRGALGRDAWPVLSRHIGYVRHVDMGALSAMAGEGDLHSHVAALPGAFVHPAAALLHVEGARDEALARRLDSAFTIGDRRSFDQDPRFGLSVMSEIASRALSPAVNDPGTAIDLIGRGVRVLTPWRGRKVARLLHPRIWVPELRIDEMFTDFFRPIARDGAGLIEVQIRLQKALIALARIDAEVFGQAALHSSDDALERALPALALESDREALRRLNGEVRAIVTARR